jgi:hypothetical protein
MLAHQINVLKELIGFRHGKLKEKEKRRGPPKRDRAMIRKNRPFKNVPIMAMKSVPFGSMLF